MTEKKFATFTPYSTDGQGKKEMSLGLGDRVERFIKPIAVILKLPCVKEDKTLNPESPCAKRRNKLNEIGHSIGIGNPS